MNSRDISIVVEGIYWKIFQAEIINKNDINFVIFKCHCTRKTEKKFIHFP